MLRLTRQLFSVLFSCLLTLSVLTAGTALADDAKKSRKLKQRRWQMRRSLLRIRPAKRRGEQVHSCRAIISTKMREQG